MLAFDPGDYTPSRLAVLTPDQLRDEATFLARLAENVKTWGHSELLPEIHALQAAIEQAAS